MGNPPLVKNYTHEGRPSPRGLLGRVASRRWPTRWRCPSVYLPVCAPPARAGPDLEIQTLQEGEVSADLTDPFRKQ